jgi:hypothetical protein
MYSQSNFFYGGINTDDEDRLIPNADFRDAFYSRNYGINTSDEGALQSMTGNLLRTNNNLPIGINIVIGACEDTEGKDATTSGNLILFVWNDLNNHTIWRYSTQDLSYTKILESEILNFKLDYPIYHAAVVNNLLYWTDNYFNSYEGNDFNPPRKINIEKAILYTESGGTDPNGYSEITFDNLDWIKHPPLFSPEPVYFTDTTETANNLKNKLFQFRYQYIYDDNEESAWSPISIMALPPSGEYISQTVNIDPSVDNTINVTLNTGSSIARLIRVAYRIGNTGEFFLYKEFIKEEEGWADNDDVTVSFKNETSGPAISNSERNYDLIPQVAKAIEYLPSNEFAIANYVEGYDKIEVSTSDFQFTIDRIEIEDTAFTAPLADFINHYISGARMQIISLCNYGGDDFVKYRFEPGDILIIQLKDLEFYLNNTTLPDPSLYFVVPEIDGTLYTTDLSKITYLNTVLIDFLGENGIDALVVPANTISIGSNLITWDTLQLNGKTWFNQTENQISTIPSGTPPAVNTNNYTSKITILRNNKSVRTFKTGANHEFAIQYYDRANRDGTAILIPAGEVYNPFNTDLSDNNLNNNLGFNRQPYYTQMLLEIANDFQPPIWATNYQILYKPSTNIANFQQRSVKSVIYNPDNTISLTLEDYYKSDDNGQFVGASINQNPSQGDLVRFVRKRALFEKESNNVLLANGNNSITTSLVVTNTYIFDLATYLTEAYDPGSDFDPITGIYTVPSTGVYNFDFLGNVEFTWDGTYADPSSASLQVGVTINGGAFTQIGMNNTYNNPSNPLIISTNNHTNNPTLTAGDQIKFYIRVIFSPLGPVYSPTGTLDITGLQVKVLNGFVDYDNYHYYPEYVTDNINKIQELNVMLYDPAGGPEGEEMITVNYFDSNLLGDYLQYTGTNTNKTLVSGGFQIEIYTPKKQSENDPWFETGIEFPILNAHTEDRVHGGDTNQVLNITNAELNLDCGDVYIRQRIMATGYAYTGDLENIGDANDNLGAWFCEDPHYSDYYISNWNNKGRVAIYSPFAKRQHLKSSIYHTNAFIDNTQINGLSRVEFFNNVALKEEQGGINKLIQVGDILKAFQDRKITSVYIQKAFALNGDGTNNVILSDKTFAGVRPHDDDYGTIHAGSVSRIENNVFFYDYYNSAFAVVTGGGVINICEQEKKFSKGVRDLTSRVNNIYGGYNNANIWSHINRNNNEYTFYVSDKISENLPIRYEVSVARFASPNLIFLDGNYTSAFAPGTQIFIEGSPNVENNGSFITGSDRYLPGSNETEIQIPILPNFVTEDCVDVVMYWYGSFTEISGEAVSYSYERNRWITRLNHGVSFATQLGSRAYSTGGGNIFTFGELYEENFGSELTFLGTSRTQQLDFIFNDNPSVVKRFYTHLQQANYPFYVEVSVPANQTYPLGMSSNIPSAVLKNQEGYYVSRYFRDLNDPAFTSPLEARMNGRELRGYVLKHTLTNSDTSVKKILMNVGVNFAASEPIIQ